MLNGSNDTMVYNLYADAARSTVFGSNNSGTYPGLVINRNITLLSTNIVFNGSVTVYGRVSSPQATVSPGNYSTTLPGGLSGNFLTFRYNEALLSLGTYPTCNAGGVSGGNVVAPSLVVSASVAPACILATATDLNFGTVAGLLLTNTDQTSLLRMTCTNRAAWQVGLDNGQNASGTIRRMKSGGSYVTYELYNRAARGVGDRWGNTLNSDTATGSGSGTEQTLTVYGRLPAQAPQAAGAYTDTITVLVTY
jgi:spore coat protein U-like protein